MLSIANPSDPSRSSSNVVELGADDRSSEQFILQKADLEEGLGETQTLHFSIRDYVFGSRRKSICTNWPFPRQWLQLCLKHDIRDLLPPFQPPSSVKAHCLSSPLPEIGENLLPDGETNSTADLVLKRPGKADGRCSGEEDCEFGSTATNHRDIEGVTPQLGEAVAKRCKLILKTQVSRLEDIESSSMASEIMAPKVCPVCKTFSSTSNTTLNAHMDQCLSMESDTTLIEDKATKPRVKPRKKRLMEDIYATSSRCSLEDLDKRNGSSWAKESTLVAPVTENDDACVVAKKLRSSRVHGGDDRDEGEVYVDSNGIKLRILSKLNDAPRTVSGTSEGVVGDGNFILANNKNVGLICSREMELKQKNNKLNSSKLFKDKAALGVSCHEESHQEEGSSLPLSSKKDRYHMSFASATLQSWSCSKRSNLSKKNTQKGFHKSLENSKLVHQMTVFDSRKMDRNTCFAAECHSTELSESSNLKFVHIPAKTLQNKETQEKSSQRNSLEGAPNNNILRLKLPRQPCTRRERLKLQDPHGIGRTLTGTSHVPQKIKRVSTLRDLNSNVKHPHGSLQLEQADESKREVCSESNGEGQPRYGKAVAMESTIEDVVAQRLNPGSIVGQDSEPKDSEKPFEDMTSARALLGKAEDSSVITGSDEAGATTEMDACVMQVEVLRDKPIEKADEMEHRDVESQAKGTFAQEIGVSFTGLRDLGTDCPRESSLVASHPLASVERNDLVISGETFMSASISSTISPASLMDSKCKALEGKAVSRPPTNLKHLSLPLPFIITKEGTREVEMGLIQQAQKVVSERKPQQPSDHQPCLCAWQSLVTGNMPNSKPKMYHNLHYRPISSSPSSPSSSFSANSRLRTNVANTQSLESPTGSTLTRTCSEVGATSPSCGTPMQSSSNSILRLMGKNLMVMHHEEPAQLPKAHSPATDNHPSVQLLPSPTCFAPYASASSREAFFSSAPQMNHRLCINKEVLEIDSFSNGDIMPKGAIFHGTLGNQLLSRDDGFGPSYLMQKGSHMKFPSALLPSPLLFRSPSTAHLTPPFCYPQSLR